MSDFGDRFNEGARASVQDAITFVVKLITGTILGLTVALTARNMMEMSDLLFVFIVMIIAALLIRVTRSWGLLSVIILMLVLSLVGVLLKLYIHTSAA